MKAIKGLMIGLSVIVVLALLAFGALFLYNNMDSGGNFRTFYVQYGSEEIATEKRNFELPRSVVNIFECKALTKNDGYTVTIKPAPGIRFDITIDDKTLGYEALTDLTPAFKIQKDGNKFTLPIIKNFTIQNLISALYPESTVTASEPETDKDIFCLSVTSGDGQKTVNIYFH